MKQYSTDRYRVEIYSDKTFAQDSTDNNNYYDFVYFVKSEYQFSSVYGIKIYQENILLKSAVIGSIGGATGIHKTSVIIEDDRLLICCSHSIFCLSIPDLTLLWQTQADSITCFEIYKYKDSYIVRGELEISRLDRDGNIIWQLIGADIFTTIDGEDNFELKENYIIATDFENRIYKFSYSGKIIS